MSQRIRRLIRREIDGRKERKQYVQTYSQFSSNLSWVTPNPLCTIAYGGGLAQRDGERIRVKAINCKFDCLRDPTNTYDAKIRIVFFWMNRSESVPDMTQMFTASAGIPLLTFRNQDWLDDYVTLLDTIINIPNTQQLVHFEKYFKLDHLVHFDGVNAGDVAKGSIYWSHMATAAPMYPCTVNCTIKIIYQDD